MTDAPPVRWTKDLVAQLRTQMAHPPEAPREKKTEDWRYHEAAAVLAWFELNPTLQPIGANAQADTAAMARLVEDSICWSDSGQRLRWTLKNDVRKQMLARLQTVESIQAALACNPNRPPDILQRIFERTVKGDLGSVDSLQFDELTATLQVLDWLPPTVRADVPDLPEESKVRQRIDRESLLAPFRRLSNEQFRGREKELDTLRDYVGVLKASSAGARFGRGVRQLLNWHEKPPLVVSGPGGIGKSTLLSHFILEHVEQEPALPFIYLDCDRPGLAPEEPVTLLLEGVRQLGIQFPNFARAAGDWIRIWQDKLGETTEDFDPGSDVLSRGTQNRTELLKSCAIFIEELDLGARPLLFILDTFEEVQYRGNAYVTEIWRFLEEFQRHLPRLRTVVVGRARVLNLPAENLQLDGLTAEAAQSFLQAHGIANAETAQAIAAQLRRNPLSLKLAVQLLRHETAGASGLEDLDTGSFLKRLDDDRIQGELYRRILSHIRREDVRRLAHPGLVLRRITPEIIEHVLAGPCGVKMDSPAQAVELFQELRREVALVNASSGGTQAVRHRSDVRRVMLELLRKAEPKLTAEIEEAAVRFYESAADQGVENRAEEIYHRIALGQTGDEIQRRWIPGVENFLRNAVEDFSGPPQIFLAARLGIAPETLQLDEESDENWELIAVKEAEDLLRLEHPEEALVVLRRRGARSEHSPVHLVEARALFQLGRAVEARQLARGALQKWESQTPPEVLDLAIIVAQADEVIGESLDTDFPARFEHLAHSFPENVRVISLGLSWARLLKKASMQRVVSARKSYEQLQSAITNALSGLSEDTLRQAPELMRSLVAEGILNEEKVVTRIQAIIARGEASVPAQRRGSIGEARKASGHGTIRAHFTAAQLEAFSQALLNAFATVSELESLALLCFGRSLTDLVPSGPMPLIVHELVSVAESRRQLGDLLTAALELRPSSSALQHLASELETVRHDSTGPAQTTLIAGLPFLGRPRLLQFLASVDDPQTVPVLLITGPPGSGKSYSLNVIRHVAHETARFDFVGASAKEDGAPANLARRLALEAGWNSETIPRQGDLSVPRFNRVLANWIVSQAARRRKPLLFFIDDLESAEMIEFVERLAGSISASTISSLKLILASSGAIAFSPEIGVETEKLTGLTLNDALQYLRSFVPDRDTFELAYHHLEETYRDVAKSSDARGLTTFLVRSVEKIAEEFRPL
jgi:cellulose synthase operon protein C